MVREPVDKSLIEERGKEYYSTIYMALNYVGANRPEIQVGLLNSKEPLIKTPIMRLTENYRYIKVMIG